MGVGRRWTRLLGLLATGFMGVTAGAAQSVSGFAMLGGQAALVWSEGAGSFRLWRVQMGQEPVWTAVEVPAELAGFEARKRQEKDGPYVRVEAFGGVVRLLWVSHGICQFRRERLAATTHSTAEAENVLCPYAVVQASVAVAKLGRADAWTVSHSWLKDVYWRKEQRVDAIRMMGAAGWMTLEGDSLMNQMPQVLLTTSDGGQHWAQRAAKGLPLGTDFPQVLLAGSASEAWMALTLPSDETVAAWRSRDFGETWVKDAGFPKSFAWCPDCVEGRFWRWPDAEGRICLGVALAPANEQSGAVDAPVVDAGVARVCRNGGGEGWSAAEKMAEPGGTDAAPEVAEETLAGNGFGLAPVSARGSYRSALWMSADDGRSWRTAPAALGGNDVWVEQMDADKADVLALLKSTKDGTTRLMESGSDGARWTELTAPARK